MGGDGLTRTEQRRFVRNHMARIKDEIFYHHFNFIPKEWGPAQLKMFVHKCFDLGNISDLTPQQYLDYTNVIEQHEQDLR